MGKEKSSPREVSRRDLLTRRAPDAPNRALTLQGYRDLALS
jgi:hypothetical protein